MTTRNTARTALAGIATGALLTGGILLGASAASADPATLVVGNSSTCAGAQFGTIQGAVDDASSGDTIKVCPGTYGEHVTINTPDLTLQGGQAGVDARGKRNKKNNTVVSNPSGAFVIGGTADGTTIDGFVISGATGNAVGVADFYGSSGLTLVNNVIQLNGNGVNLENPDGSQPARISQNSFVNNNAGGNPGYNSGTGTGVFISNGPANNTTISNNTFKQHSQTAINFAGSSADPSTGLSVTGNKSTDDATFVVAVNSIGAVISTNSVTTSDNAPGGHGTGILDFGSNTSLRIADNTMKSTGDTTSSGVLVSNITGTNSQFTAVSGNRISGWYNDIKIESGNRDASVSGNKISGALNDGILVQPDVSGVTLAGNKITGATTFSCEDQTTGSGTAGTANTWTSNVGSIASSPAGICKQKA